MASSEPDVSLDESLPMTQQVLHSIYYQPENPGSFGGINRLYREARKILPKIQQHEVERFLANNRASSLHRPARKHFLRNPTVVSSIDEQWQADLADMQKLARTNSGVHYLLTVIDVFSKFAWVVPLKSKTAKSLVDGFRHLLEVLSYPRRPKRLQTDKGKEFLNKEFQKLLKESPYNIEHFSTWSDTKAAVVERFNRTLKTRIATWLSANSSTQRYLDVLPKIVEAYNHSFHRAIGMSPAEVNKSNEMKVWRNLYKNGRLLRPHKSLTKKRKLLVPGAKVRISRIKGDFEKGYMPNWSEEYFVIKSPSKSGGRRQAYQLEDTAGETLHGRWYPEELLPIDQNQLLVEKVLRRRTNAESGIKEALIKWSGWPKKFNSWIPESELEPARKP